MQLHFANPFFESGSVFLADNDLFINRQDKLQADLAFFEGFKTFYIIRVDYVFPVGPVKDFVVELFFQFCKV